MPLASPFVAPSIDAGHRDDSTSGGRSAALAGPSGTCRGAVAGSIGDPFDPDDRAASARRWWENE